MKVLMFGWEFPPFKSGGLGTACYDLTKGLAAEGLDVTFVMPFAPDSAKAEFVKLIGTNKYAKNIKIRGFKTILTPYMTATDYEDAISRVDLGSGSSMQAIYGKNLFEEVLRYAKVAEHIAREEDFDLIHAHDWMTYYAGLRARKVSGKPLIVHIHATEFDRTGGNPNQAISHIEYQGMSNADLVIANSNWTKNNVIKAYNLPAKKVEVVHWGIEEDKPEYSINFVSPMSSSDKIVLFLGRITIQKGPDYFVDLANRVSAYVPNVKFVMAGSGDMFNRMVSKVASLGLSDKFIFPGFLNGVNVHRAFQMADLYVMPSVSEPFGLVALESMKNGTPILVSNQSGASEVINNCFKADFWDIDDMANKVVNALLYPSLLNTLQKNTVLEAKKFNLAIPARKHVDIYNKVLATVGGIN